MIVQAIKLLVLSAVLGLGINLVSPHKIPFVGTYRELSSGEGPIVPPSAQPGDAPFIAIDDAQMEHSLKQAVFVDARPYDEFKCGTIPGAINVSFEDLPETKPELYVDSILKDVVPKDHRIIVFCSGEECDLSLQLARNMQIFGYTDLAIFFGGAREWEKAGFEMERREKCE